MPGGISFAGPSVIWCRAMHSSSTVETRSPAPKPQSQSLDKLLPQQESCLGHKQTPSMEYCYSHCWRTCHTSAPWAGVSCFAFHGRMASVLSVLESAKHFQQMVGVAHFETRLFSYLGAPWTGPHTLRCSKKSRIESKLQTVSGNNDTQMNAHPWTPAFSGSTTWLQRACYHKGHKYVALFQLSIHTNWNALNQQDDICFAMLCWQLPAT